MSSKKKDRSFRLGTTSFIYPDHIIPNVRKTAAFFDEIELLVFESFPREVLPSKADVAELALLAQEFDLTYNIHLPVDICLTDPSAQVRKNAVDTIARVVGLFEPLDPTTHTLHLDMQGQLSNQQEVLLWEQNACRGIDTLLSHVSPQILSIETLDYSPEYFEKILQEYPLCLCIDAGHHFKYGHDLETTFDTYSDRVPVIHLHGVDFSAARVKDHIGLDRLDREKFILVTRLLETYSGVVSLEVFNLENLNRSLEVLSCVFKNIPFKLFEQS